MQPWPIESFRTGKFLIQILREHATLKYGVPKTDSKHVSSLVP